MTIEDMIKTLREYAISDLEANNWEWATHRTFAQFDDRDVFVEVTILPDYSAHYLVGGIFYADYINTTQLEAHSFEDAVTLLRFAAEA